MTDTLDLTGLVCYHTEIRPFYSEISMLLERSGTSIGNYATYGLTNHTMPGGLGVWRNCVTNKLFHQ